MNLKEVSERYIELSGYIIEIHSSKPHPMFLIFREDNLHHLLGIQHLVDREYISKFREKKKFPQKLIVDELFRKNITSSKYFNTKLNVDTISIAERVELFNFIPWVLLNSQCHVVIKQLGTIPANYLLWTKHKNKFLCIHMVYNDKMKSLSPVSLSYKTTLDRDYQTKSFPVKIFFKKH